LTTTSFVLLWLGCGGLTFFVERHRYGPAYCEWWELPLLFGRTVLAWPTYVLEDLICALQGEDPD
jgi:hypothetical protein